MPTLGCARRYDAVIHWQGGKKQFARLDGITALSWARKLGDYSEASVTLVKSDLSPQCRAQLSPKHDEHGNLIRPGIEPWAHELSLYRDRALVWQGPVVEMTETREQVEIHARDMLAWMDRRVVDLNLEGGGTGDKFRGETGLVLRNIFERTWPGTHETNPYDNPGITEHARIDDTPDKFTETEKIWKGSRTVGDLVRQIIQNGIDLWTLGRKVFAVPDFYRIDHAPYRLTEQHLNGDLEVRRLGLDMATEGFVVGQDAATETASVPGMPGGGGGQPPTFGKWPPEEGPGSPQNQSTPPYYGRITRFSQSQALTGAPGATPDQSQPALQQVAQSIRSYGFPCPVALVIPEQASLNPNAPISMDQLVPGRVINVSLTSYITKTQDIYRLNEVQVTWQPGQQSGSKSSSTSKGSSSTSSSSSQTGSSSSGTSSGASAGGGSEQVQISLVTLRKPPVPPENSQSSSTSSSGTSGASSSSSSASH